jgi:thioredoxin reductase (NADPH)
VRVEGPYKFVKLADGTELICKSLFIATGMEVRRLGAEAIDEFTGAGVYYGAALTEAALYRDQHVFIVGGANSAGQSAMLFSQYASQVTMLVRGDGLRASMSQYLIDQIDGTDNIEVLSHTEVAQVAGDNHLQTVTLKNNQSDEEETVDTGAMFIFVGAVPHSELVKDVVQIDEAGFIITGEEVSRDGDLAWTLKRDPMPLETSAPGIFAGGDVQSGAIKRVASAVGHGAIAVSFVHRYLNTV